jgi:flavin reductase (DIM6/NTAB) family NADH-FMN oxidoreductase RutF
MFAQVSPSNAALAVSATEFRNAFALLATTVSVITTSGTSSGLMGVTCSALSALSDDPTLVICCVHQKSQTNAAIKTNRIFCVNSLAAGQQQLSDAFAGIGQLAMDARFKLAAWDRLVTGAPRFTDALLALDCILEESWDIGTHSLFVGRVLATAVNDTPDPLLYRRRAYVTTRML